MTPREAIQNVKAVLHVAYIRVLSTVESQRGVESVAALEREHPPTPASLKRPPTRQELEERIGELEAALEQHRFITGPARVVVTIPQREPCRHCNGAAVVILDVGVTTFSYSDTHVHEDDCTHEEDDDVGF